MIECTQHMYFIWDREHIVGPNQKGFRIKHRVPLTLTVEPISSAFESAFELVESALELESDQ